jgi:hypothetical protein
VLELFSEGRLITMTPSVSETSGRNLRLVMRLERWQALSPDLVVELAPLRGPQRHKPCSISNGASQTSLPWIPYRATRA